MKNLLSIDPKICVPKIQDYISIPTVIYVNSFDEDGATKFDDDIDDAHFRKQPVIPVVINSFGGSIYGLNSMISAILNSDIPVATIVKGKAMSAGAVLFGFGTEGYRFIDPYGTLMIHDAGSGNYGKVEEVKASTYHLDHLNQTGYKRLAKHLGHKDNYFLDLIATKKHADWYLTAKEAKKHKLANHLKIPSFRTTLTLETKFEV